MGVSGNFRNNVFPHSKPKTTNTVWKQLIEDCKRAEQEIGRVPRRRNRKERKAKDGSSKLREKEKKGKDLKDKLCQVEQIMSKRH